ncbi:hypothetical protein NQ314_016820 [Rhamnusium bicolor]|uniref:Uncharacterized protein n=1 Tax=Rhamnusium bicolor TaxID=1586634 RepID=A0AAV8WVL4_9CUCU|nr:hypothetical protein NQ314_016820 [Rhamnusium bicolor]
MDIRTGETTRERSRRPVRNKRYSRRAYGEDKRPPKRLFTPEIKRFLKDWLVCNWFANWRRKLKNAGKEPQQKTWGDLIKTYNNQVQGNVEHFSICSDDSIWEEPESNFEDEMCDKKSYSTDLYNLANNQVEHSYTYQEKNCINNNITDIQNQCYFISSTTETDLEANPFSQATNSKYKNHIMEKYLRDCQKPEYNLQEPIDENKPSMISKWLESAANFKPSESSYLDWTFSKSSKKKNKKTTEPTTNLLLMHGREELDAAEALTTLANSRSYKI